MEHWTQKRIFVSALFIFTIIGAVWIQWGDGVAFFNIQHTNGSHFGLTTPQWASEDLKIQHSAVDPLIWGLAWILGIVIWFKLQFRLYYKLGITLAILALVTDLLYGLLNHTTVFVLLYVFFFILQCFSVLSWLLWATFVFVVPMILGILALMLALATALIMIVAGILAIVSVAILIICLFLGCTPKEVWSSFCEINMCLCGDSSHDDYDGYEYRSP